VTKFIRSNSVEDIMRNWLTILLVSVLLPSFAQEDTTDIEEEVISFELAVIEDSLAFYRQAVFAAQEDYPRMVANEKFLSWMRTALDNPNSFDYNFKKIQSISTIVSPDKSFRIFNWNVENDDLSQQFYCFIQQNNKDHRVTELIESPIDPRKPEKVVLDEYEWMGALYYDIIPVKSGGKTFYTLLGWDGNNRLTNKKIIDVFSWSSNGNLKIGAPIFKSKNGIKKRIVFEHNGDVSMTLTYHEDKSQIIFNHLAPMDQRLDGNVAYYVPDLTFNAYELSKGKWIFKEDVDVRNKQKPKNDFYNFPKDPVKMPNSKK